MAIRDRQAETIAPTTVDSAPSRYAGKVLAVFRYVANAQSHRLVRAFDGHTLSVELYLPGGGRLGAENGSGHVRSTRPYQPRHADDFAAPKLERHI